jgi:hypothetical protein
LSLSSGVGGSMLFGLYSQHHKNLPRHDENNYPRVPSRSSVSFFSLANQSSRAASRKRPEQRVLQTKCWHGNQPGWTPNQDVKQHRSSSVFLQSSTRHDTSRLRQISPAYAVSCCFLSFSNLYCLTNRSSFCDFTASFGHLARSIPRVDKMDPATSLPAQRQLR